MIAPECYKPVFDATNGCRYYIVSEAELSGLGSGGGGTKDRTDADLKSILGKARLFAALKNLSNEAREVPPLATFTRFIHSGDIVVFNPRSGDESVFQDLGLKRGGLVIP